MTSSPVALPWGWVIAQRRKGAKEGCASYGVGRETMGMRRMQEWACPFFSPRHSHLPPASRGARVAGLCRARINAKCPSDPPFLASWRLERTRRSRVSGRETSWSLVNRRESAQCRALLQDHEGLKEYIAQSQQSEQRRSKIIELFPCCLCFLERPEGAGVRYLFEPSHPDLYLFLHCPSDQKVFTGLSVIRLLSSVFLFFCPLIFLCLLCLFAAIPAPSP